MRVAFEGYGCTLSYGESRRARMLAEEAGYETTDDALEASVVVVHTCTVIGRTERRMLKRIDDLAMSGRSVVVAGCLPRAQREHVDELAEDRISIVLGKGPQDIVEALGRVDGSILEDPSWLPEVEAHLGSRPDPARRTDAIVPIASGCAGACTFCITRLAWGPLESTPIEEVVASVRQWLDLGFREVQLTAQDTGAWGLDTGDDERLPDLVRAVSSIDGPPGEYRVRVGMLNPDTLRSILEDLVDALSHPGIYRFVHLPVQSGSDRVLSLMGRRYTTSDFEGLVSSLRERLPDLTLHTDVICGFPSEEDDEFEATMDLLRRTRPDVVNVKAFSPRPGTQAHEMEGTVQGTVVKRRTRRASTLGEELVGRALAEHVGETVEVLVTELGKIGTGTLMARDTRYNPVVVPDGGGGGLSVGDTAQVRLAEARGVYLLGSVV